jgi:hypothetical protein
VPVLDALRIISCPCALANSSRASNSKAYVAFRYNTAEGQLVGTPSGVSIVRTQYAFGFFLTKNVLAKLEYVNQDYNKFLATDIRNGGNFKGFMLEGAVAF